MPKMRHAQNTLFLFALHLASIGHASFILCQAPLVNYKFSQIEGTNIASLVDTVEQLGTTSQIHGLKVNGKEVIVVEANFSDFSTLLSQQNEINSTLTREKESKIARIKKITAKIVALSWLTPTAAASSYLVSKAFEAMYSSHVPINPAGVMLVAAGLTASVVFPTVFFWRVSNRQAALETSAKNGTPTATMEELVINLNQHLKTDKSSNGTIVFYVTKEGDYNIDDLVLKLKSQHKLKVEHIFSGEQ